MLHFPKIELFLLPMQSLNVVAQQRLPRQPKGVLPMTSMVLTVHGSSEVTAAILVSHSISIVFPNKSFAKVYVVWYACREAFRPPPANISALVGKKKKKRNSCNSSSDQ